MELSKQIKARRLEAKLTQDELAAKIFVTRQTVSNWENDKSYPDLKSLLLLSALFHVSLDTLVNGDLEEMKGKINPEDIRRMNRDGAIFAVLLLASMVSAAPLFLCMKLVGILIWAALFGVTMYYALRIERQKKAHDIQTYREIVAFTQGKTLDELEKARESGKRPYQKVLLAVCSGLITLAVTAAIGFLLTR